MRDLQMFVSKAVKFPVALRMHGYDIVCPYCGDKHDHGKSPGHRDPHCAVTYSFPATADYKKQKKIVIDDKEFTYKDGYFIINVSEN